MAKPKKDCSMLLKASDIQVGMMLVSPRKKVTKTRKAGKAVMLELGSDITVTVPATKKVKVLST